MTIHISPLGIWLFGFFTGMASVVAVVVYLSYYLQRVKNHEDSERFGAWLQENSEEVLRVMGGAEDGAES